MDLTQTEADALLAMEKVRANDDAYDFPGVARGVTIPLVSSNKREDFLLDMTRGRIELRQVTYQNRARAIVVLARLDIAGPPHTNPDGVQIECPHIHLYREDFGDKWAFPVPTQFSNLADIWQALQDFMSFINLTSPPNIQRNMV
ncbi:MAG: hypothetical protein Q7T33_10325 [Dehalococcoidia bacterium]|nr:hypothetical protein [Dehalococcoidia bacterium]